MYILPSIFLSSLSPFFLSLSLIRFPLSPSLTSLEGQKFQPLLEIDRWHSSEQSRAYARVASPRMCDSRTRTYIRIYSLHMYPYTIYRCIYIYIYMVFTCVNITYIYTLGADVSEITERGTLVGQGNKVQCTHPFTVASLSRFLSYPPTANVSLSVTFASFFVYRYRLFFSFSCTGTATAVASDSVSNGSGGHTILRLNSTDTAAQLRSFSSYSFFFLFLSLFLSLFRHQSFFLLPFFPSAHVQFISLALFLFLYARCFFFLYSLSLFTLLDTSAIRLDTRRSVCVSCSIENILNTYIHILWNTLCAVSSLAIEKSDYERPLIF